MEKTFEEIEYYLSIQNTHINLNVDMKGNVYPIVHEKKQIMLKTEEFSYLLYFTDPSTSQTKVHLSAQNSRLYDFENPNYVIKRTSQRYQVWWAILFFRIICPHFIQEN